ncbi:unnamed protein product [Closterium sp. Naga37s-1]|nr:unnamed protein product [Closterium sp. Naga37s-1]
MAAEGAQRVGSVAARSQGSCWPPLDSLPCSLPALHLPCELPALHLPCELPALHLPCELPALHLPCSRDAGGHGSAVRPTFLSCPSNLSLQVAEMWGGMAVLSHASTGTTILLALPLGGGEDADGRGEDVGSRGEDAGSSRGGGEGSGEEVGKLSAVAEEQESGSQTAARPAAGARALVHAHTFPQAEMERGGVGEAERVVRGVVAGRGVAVVDDNAVNRMVVRRTLQGYGARVLLLPSGEDALQALSSATPSPPIHVLLLDLHMPPGIDGSVPLTSSLCCDLTLQQRVLLQAPVPLSAS